MGKRDFSRRDFIRTSGAIAAGLAISPALGCSSSAYDAKGLPTVVLGKTGVTIPRMVVGCGSRFMAIPEDRGLEILETALNNGLYHWDTASTYKNEKQFSEERLGKLLKLNRNKVFVSSKVESRKADEARLSVETSLKRLQTDYLDLIQIHSITNEDEVRKFGDKDGVLPVLKKMKDEGLVRYIGFTGHTSASAMKLAAELYDFDTMLIALNHHQQGKQPFEEQPVPYAAEKGMGVMTIKLIRPRETVKELDPKDLIRYGLSLKNVHAVVIGIDNLEVLNTNIELMKNFTPLSDDRMKELHASLSPFFNSPHLPWMHPEYRDGIA
jgi:uncharacterized protein